ncbi:hypothetical protein IV203_002781 [Nitzschia inconspicua]|uniref:CSC1/OSCA1-like cytosolic domain-containing protein n=1 Tax=Nitzschia inconspicua TaxID=303405 RepID=A0A9K3PNN4_9STRA|nr:hypothetical protein IV203_002781 [Nitzschia inconspicua]
MTVAALSSSPDLRQRRNLPTYPSTLNFTSPSMNSLRCREGLVGANLSEEEANAILQQLADKDKDNKKTWSRVFVERYLLDKNWYYPKRPNRPDLKRAWAYFEHVTLPRHFTGEQTVDTKFRRAEPGEHEKETELYDPFRTPQQAFVEWGVGIDLYFISVWCFAIFMFIAACMNIPSMMFYSSEEYNGDPSAVALSEETENLPFDLKASAICSNFQWVVCSDCTPEQWNRDPTRFATAEDGTILVLRNFCNGTQGTNAFTNYATLIFAIIWISLVSLYLRARGVRFDEDKITTSDYSVNVKNPPPDAYDPEEWHTFFSQFATDGDQVTCVTVTLDNEELVANTFYYRNFRSQLLRKIPADTDVNDEEATRAAIKKYIDDNGSPYYIESGCIGWILKTLVVPPCNLFNMFLPADKLYDKMCVLKKKIIELQEKEYKVSQVFVTFETEHGQRAALSALQLGLLDVLTVNKKAVTQNCLFRDTLLHVVQPAEPNAVRWLDLDDTPLKIFTMCLITFLVNVLFIAFATVCIYFARQNVGPFFSGILVTTFNSTIPQAIKLIMMFEPHQNEGGFQRSLYLNITLFRWVLTAIVPQVITPHTSTLSSDSSDLLPTIRGILVSECWLTPLLRLSDYMTNAKKHIIAPRAQNQEDMMLWFQGTFYNLGERYTDLTKILFVVFYYSSLFPFVFVYGFIILFIQYFVDRFSLFRLWGWNPQLGAELASFSRKYMILGCLAAFAIMSSFIYAQFPYDNVCDPSEPVNGAAGSYSGVTLADGVLVNEGSENAGIVVVSQDTEVAFCDQSRSGSDEFWFPATKRVQGDGPLTWFTNEQARITAVYGWTSVVIVAFLVIYLFGRSAGDLAMFIFTGVYQPEGEPQNIDFSSNLNIFAYVPQLKYVGHPFPYICCDIDDLDQDLIGWNDASHSYDYYNLIFEIPHKSQRRTIRMEKNTREFPTIADFPEYASLIKSSQQSLDSTENDPAKEGKTLRGRKTPLYSIIKHYPTKWQLALREQWRNQQV